MSVGGCLPSGSLRALHEALDAAARDAAVPVGTLDPKDLRNLIGGFYRAEALAQDALERAAEQVPAEFRGELAEQIADEARHVALFASWLDALPDVVLPAPTVRQPEHWFVSLLFNELAGHCQFHTLAALLDGERRSAVLHVLGEERVHVVRLAGWLAGSEAVQVSAHRFCRALSGRMRQFFPREELAAVRAALREVIARLVTEVAGVVGTAGDAP